MAPGFRDQQRGLISAAARSPRLSILGSLGALAIAAAPSAQAGERTPKEAVEAVLERHHGPLKATFDASFLELREDPEDAPIQVIMAGDKIRIDYPGRGADLLTGTVGWRCAPGEEAKRLTGEALGAVQRLRNQVRAISLLPLYEADKIRRLGPGLYSLQLAGGETWRLRIDESKSSIEELSGPIAALQFAEFVDTGYTLIPSVIERDEQPDWLVTFRATDLQLQDALFADPSLQVDLERTRKEVRHTKVVRTPNELPQRPEVQSVPERTYYAVADPGRWNGRCAALGEAASSLGRRRQICAGLPTYQLVEDGIEILVPFQPDPTQDSPPFVRRDGDDVRFLAEHEAVVFSPPPGAWDEILAASRERIASYLAEHELEAAGPMRVIPFLAPDRVPTDEQLKGIHARFEQPITPR